MNEVEVQYQVKNKVNGRIAGLDLLPFEYKIFNDPVEPLIKLIILAEEKDLVSYTVNYLKNQFDDFTETELDVTSIEIESGYNTLIDDTKISLPPVEEIKSDVVTEKQGEITLPPVEETKSDSVTENKFAEKPTHNNRNNQSRRGN